MRTNFQEISVKAVKRWTDADGRKRQQTKRFWMTVNPFNKNPDGTVRSASQIRAVLLAERDAWLNEPAKEQDHE